MIFMDKRIEPTPGFKMRLLDEDDEKERHDRHPYIIRILIYIFIIIGILIAFALIVMIARALFVSNFLVHFCEIFRQAESNIINMFFFQNHDYYIYISITVIIIIVIILYVCKCTNI